MALALLLASGDYWLLTLTNKCSIIGTSLLENVWKFGGLQMGEGNANEYKQKIIEIVNQIENIKILRLIFGFAKAGYEEEKAGS